MYACSLLCRMNNEQKPKMRENESNGKQHIAAGSIFSYIYKDLVYILHIAEHIRNRFNHQPTFITNHQEHMHPKIWSTYDCKL